MSTNPQKTPLSEQARALLGRRQVRLALIGLGGAVLVLLIAAAMMGEQASVSEQPLVAVERGPLTISVIEAGTIQNREVVIVKSEVEGNSTILTLVPEGADVEKGDLLVELDSSGLQDNKTQQEISVQNAEASYISARENLAVTESQVQSDVTQAELTLKFAELDLQKYLEGEWPSALQEAESKIILAEEELKRAEEKLMWSEKLAAEGYIARTELESDALSLKQRQIDLEQAQRDLEVLKEYTHTRDLEQLQSDVEEAEKALERTRRKASADLIQAKADLKARESEYQRQQEKLDKINDQIAKCRIIAPVAGMVVYATTGQGSWRGNAEPLEEGQQVRERQELIHLPTTASMKAEVKVHESSLRKVTRGMDVKITVDAVPGRVFWGKVAKIGLLPDAQSVWMNPDLKVYATEIYVGGDASELRPGMTCQAEIIVEQYDDALFLPLQCITRVGGQTVVYVPTSSGPLAKPVTVGLDNNRMVRIVEGLDEGEKVLLSPPLQQSEAPVLDQAPTTQPSTQPAVELPAENAEITPPAELPFDPASLQNMTREQQRAALEKLTPEQREALRQQFGGRRGPRGEGGPRREGGPRPGGGE